MRVITLLLAEGVSVDVFTGRITPFNLLDTVFAPRFPARVARLHVLVQYERESLEPPTHFFEKLELVDSAGRNVLTAPVLEVTVGTRFHSSIHNAWNVVLERAGEYSLRVSHAGSEDGPWTELQRRSVIVDEGPHPLQPPVAKPKVA